MRSHTFTGIADVSLIFQGSDVPEYGLLAGKENQEVEVEDKKQAKLDCNLEHGTT